MKFGCGVVPEFGYMKAPIVRSLKTANNSQINTEFHLIFFPNRNPVNYSVSLFVLLRYPFCLQRISIDSFTVFKQVDAPTLLPSLMPVFLKRRTLFILAALFIGAPLLFFAGFHAGTLAHYLTELISKRTFIPEYSVVVVFIVLFIAVVTGLVYYLQQNRHIRLMQSGEQQLYEPYFDISSGDKLKFTTAFSLLSFMPVITTAAIVLNNPLSILSISMVFMVTWVSIIFIVLQNMLIYTKGMEGGKKYGLYVLPVALSVFFVLLFWTTNRYQPVDPETGEVIVNTLSTLNITIIIGSVALLLLGLQYLLSANQAIHLKRAKAEEELNFASEVQKQFLQSRKVTAPGYEIAAVSKAAQQVGGDFFCLTKNKSGESAENHVIAVGDVSGHSFGAGLIMSMLTTSFEDQIYRNCTVKEALNRLNERLLGREQRKMFCTLCAVEINDYSFSCWNAGHMPVLFFRSKSGTTDSLRLPSVALGMSHKAEFRPQTKNAMPGDYLVIYSDGLVETRDDAGRVRHQKDFDNLTNNICQKNKPADETAHLIMKEVQKQDHSPFQEDDMTLIVVKFS